MSFTRRSTGGVAPSCKGKTAFQHWYRDNQVYFITARCHDRFPAFETEAAKAIFWRQFERYAPEFEFTPFVTSLLDNHYHTVGHLKRGRNLPLLMQRVQGSVAKLVNDILEAQYGAVGLKPHRVNERGPLLPFWRDSAHKNYFDGCLRSEKQGRLTYRYVLTQCKRHGICEDPEDYPHTRVNVETDRAIKRALELKAFLEGVRYKRYQHPR